ncbi:MAG: ATP-binding cassette domain-containing protein [Candidatus Marinimicrobia bacterium]|nr:ATP-binding cassette domain-containing protein [Candidatus Neomarinimicrobiota bacterium]
MTDKLQFNLSFPKFKFEKSFTFESGLHVIYGESGRGKSALINQILGFEKEHENFVISHINCPDEVQKVFQNPDTQIVSSTLNGELAFSLECRSNDQKAISKKLEEIREYLIFEIDGNRHPATLSGGEKEMLNIVTAFSVDPQLVLIDDGLSFLNPNKKQEMIHYIQDRIEFSNCIVFWLTSDCNDLQFGNTQWELSLSSMEEWKGQIQPLEKIVHHTKANDMYLNCHDMTFTYNGNSNLFEGLKMQIDDFRSLGITGSNGSGKTTLAKLLLQIEKPESGSISLTKTGEEASIAYLEQFPEKMIGADSLADFVERLVSAEKLEKHKMNLAINNLKSCQLEWAQIKEKTALDLPWSTLRLVLTIWLINCEYDMLILDEPTFGLGRQQVLTLTHHLQLYLKNKYLIIISHDTEFIYTFCDRVYDLDQRTINAEKKNSIANG